MIVYKYMRSYKVGFVTTMNTYLCNILQVLQLLQTLHHELSRLNNYMRPDAPKNRDNRMKTITIEMLKRVKNVSAQVAGLGFDAEWEKRIGLDWFPGYIKQIWRSYRSNKVRRVPTPAHVYVYFRDAINQLPDYYIPRLQSMTYLRYLPQLIPLLQTLYNELIELIKFDLPDESINGHFRMMTATEKMLQRVNPALAQVAEWGFGKEWEKPIGLVWFKGCIVNSWRSYRNETDHQIQSLRYLKHIHRLAIANFVEEYIPRLQQPLDDIVSASVWRLD
jgi:hypothetical protein